VTERLLERSDAMNEPKRVNDADDKFDAVELMNDVRRRASALEKRLTERAAEMHAEVWKQVADFERAMVAARDRIDALGEGETSAFDELRSEVLAAWLKFKTAAERELSRLVGERRDS
jgi:hypothetical protein